MSTHPELSFSMRHEIPMLLVEKPPSAYDQSSLGYQFYCVYSAKYTSGTELQIPYWFMEHTATWLYRKSTCKWHLFRNPVNTMHPSKGLRDPWDAKYYVNRELVHWQVETFKVRGGKGVHAHQVRRSKQDDWLITLFPSWRRFCLSHFHSPHNCFSDLLLFFGIAHQEHRSQPWRSDFIDVSMTLVLWLSW